MKINEFSGLYLLNQKMNRLRGLFWIQKNIMGFPSADELLLRHTLIPFLAQDEQGDDVSILAKNVQVALYNCGQPLYDLPEYEMKAKVRICLQCLKEDASHDREAYMRVWHQFPHVKCCAVHECSLVEIHGFDLQNVRGKTYLHMNEKEVAYAKKRKKAYDNERIFRAVSVPVKNGIKAQKTDGIFLYAQCETCGEQFLTTIYACSTGRGCPICDRGRDMVSEGMKMLPKYHIIKGTHDIVHICGAKSDDSLFEVLWGGKRCRCGIGT